MQLSFTIVLNGEYMMANINSNSFEDYLKAGVCNMVSLVLKVLTETKFEYLMSVWLGELIPTRLKLMFLSCLCRGLTNTSIS